MKPLYNTLILISGLAVAGLFSFTYRTSNYDAKKNTAEVEQIQGIYIFVNSAPVTEYEYLGTVKVGLAGGSQYTDIRDNMLKRCKKQFPQADGAILHFSSGSADKCDAIKFKDIKKE